MKKILSILLLAMLSVYVSNAQAPDTLWTRTYGGNQCFGVQQTTDTGFILAGGTGGPTSDFYVVKTSAAGDTLWTKTYGGSAFDVATGIVQCSDGGYAITGTSYSFSGGNSDIYFVKTDAGGNIQWQANYGGSANDASEYLEQTADGGYIICGSTKSFGNAVQYYILKIDGSGNVDWERNYGTPGSEYSREIHQTSDGGYAFIGQSGSYGDQYQVYKLDSQGDSLWARDYGGTGDEYAQSIKITPDGGYILAGASKSFSAQYDYYAVKINAVGDVEWENTYGGSDKDWCNDVEVTGDGGYILTGWSDSFGNSDQVYIVKINSNGDTLWTTTCGRQGNENGQMVRETTDGGYIIAGWSDSYSIYSYEFYALRLEGNSTTFQLTVSIEDSWSIVSIPGLHPVDQNVDTWWSGRVSGSSVYEFIPGSGYNAITTATPTKGYWLKNNGAQTYNTGDEWPAGGILFVPHDPISTNGGWDIIGGYEENVVVSGITTTPPGLITGNVWRYSSAGGYQSADTLFPGYGYWINLTAAGLINLTGGTPKTVESFNEDWGKIIITDAAGRSSTLYAVNSGADLNAYQLPPAPPSGLFDIRFGSGRIAEDLNADAQTIEMNGLEYPVKVRVENMEIELRDEIGREVSVELKAGEEVTIKNSSINKLLVLSGEITTPTEYALEQNYPNPFNPATTIKFSLPEAANATLTIYDALGQKITELVNEKLEAGKYSYNWDAGKITSGVYIYELRTGTINMTKKMMLVK